MAEEQYGQVMQRKCVVQFSGGIDMLRMAEEKRRRELRGLGAEKLWKAMFSNGDTPKTALNAPRMAQITKAD